MAPIYTKGVKDSSSASLDTGRVRNGISANDDDDGWDQDIDDDWDV